MIGNGDGLTAEPHGTYDFPSERYWPFDVASSGEVILPKKDDDWESRAGFLPPGDDGNGLTASESPALERIAAAAERIAVSLETIVAHMGHGLPTGR